MATPGVAEKGNLNVLLEISTPGGHSSVPPAHTVRASSNSTICRSHFSRASACLQHSSGDLKTTRIHLP